MSLGTLRSLIPGQTWLTGVGAPSPILGYKTQFYLNETNGSVYQKTDDVTWVIVGSIASGASSVLSVNGQTGAVVLNANDVGAIPTTDKGAANGVATLDATGKVPSSQIPPSGASVTSVNGFTGAVTLTSTNIAEGTNLYFTNTRAQDAITGAASTIVTADLTINRALVSDASGKVSVSSVTSTELGYLSGVSSAIQTQINGKVSTSGDSMTGALVMGPIGTAIGDGGIIKFQELAANGTNFVALRAADAITTDVTWTLPAADGTPGQVLATNGSGILSWATPGAATSGTLVHPTAGSTFEYGTANISMSGAENTAIGVEAGISLTSGNGNTALGYRALKNQDSGYGSTAIGYQALYSLVTSITGGSGNNTAIGGYALSNLTSGYGNIEIAAGAFGGVFSSGNDNTFINGVSGVSNITGAVAIGKSYYNLSGQTAIATANNQFVLGTEDHRYYMRGKFEGDISMGAIGGFPVGLRFYDADESAYVGFKAPISVTSNTIWALPPADGSPNQALLTDGSGTLSWGAPSGTLVHPAIGSTYEAGSYLGTGGFANTALGVFAGYNIQGYDNVAIGNNALGFSDGNPRGLNSNVAIGSFALQGATATTSGTVGIGQFAGGAGPGDNCTFINSSSGTGYNGVVSIGRDASGNSPGGAFANNQFILGTADHRYIVAGQFGSDIVLGANAIGPGTLKLSFGAPSGAVSFQASGMTTGTTAYILPAADGLPGQSLKTDGAGNLYWG